MDFIPHYNNFLKMVQHFWDESERDAITHQEWLEYLKVICDAFSNQILFPIEQSQLKDEILEHVDTIFTDLGAIDHQDPYMVKTYIDAISENLEALKSKTLGFLFFIEENFDRNGNKIRIGHYFLINENAYICCGDDLDEVIHSVSSNCQKLKEDLLKALKKDLQVQTWICKAVVEVQ